MLRMSIAVAKLWPLAVTLWELRVRKDMFIVVHADKKDAIAQHHNFRERARDVTAQILRGFNFQHQGLIIGHIIVISEQIEPIAWTSGGDNNLICPRRTHPVDLSVNQSVSLWVTFLQKKKGGGLDVFAHMYEWKIAIDPDDLWGRIVGL